MLRASHRMEPHRLAALTTQTAQAIGAIGAHVYVVDLQQRLLVAVGQDGEVLSEQIAVDGTLAGRAYISGVIQVGSEDGLVEHWVPLVDGVDRLGVLRIDTAGLGHEVTRWAADLASVVALLLVSKSGHTDAYDRAARRQEMSLAAEMHWVLLPPLSMSTPRVSLAGIMEPAYEIGGDSFDYAINGNRLDLAVFDAMGHGLVATGASAVAVGSVRHSRRADRDLADTYRAADQALREQFDDLRFVTALIAQLDLDTGVLRWVTAGHPAPLLIRAGRVLGPLECRPCPPLGWGGGLLSDDQTLPISVVHLEPGDRVLAFSDGVTEGRRRGEEPFGQGRLIDEVEKAVLAGVGLAETMRRAGHAILDHHAHELSDDFTLVVFEYLPEPPPAE